MAKISPVSAKYIVHSTIEIDGVVDRPDVIGAVFGQTEGLLGADLELRELQRSGRIGRIEVNTEIRSGKTTGKIIIPSSLDKAETSIVAASLETIQRIGPCNAKIRVELIEDVRISKRVFIVERAKELLKKLIDSVMPDSQELADEVAYSVRIMEVQEYGRDRLPAGPTIDESDEVIVVEGRADVLNLLKHGLKNVIAINGTNVPETIIELSRRKVLTAFVDGDRGGNLILKELLGVADIDYVTRAPDGKEVEEITKKEIHKAIRSRITAEQAKLEFGGRDFSVSERQNGQQERMERTERPQPQERQQYRQPLRQMIPQMQQRQAPQYQQQAPVQLKKPELSEDEKKTYSRMLEDLIGTRGAYVLDEKLNILGKVPLTELATTVKSLNTGIHAVVFDGAVEKNLLQDIERTSIKNIVAMESKVKQNTTRVNIITSDDL